MIVTLKPDDIGTLQESLRYTKQDYQVGMLSMPVSNEARRERLAVIDSIAAKLRGIGRTSSLASVDFEAGEVELIRESFRTSLEKVALSDSPIKTQTLAGIAAVAKYFA